MPLLAPPAMEIDGDSAKHFKKEELFEAAESGDFSLFKLLAQEKLRRVVSLRNEDGRWTASVVNSSDEEGWAPLHSAASSGNLKIVEVLQNKGADGNLKNEGGRTALHYSASKAQLKIAEILIAHGVKLNIKDKVGCTPLHRAASTGITKLCEFLIEEGTALVDADIAGQTPLMIAVECDNREVKIYYAYGSNQQIIKRKNIIVHAEPLIH
ncbi:uncharacterized protein [Primulina eburnea]|uniref:uncharacterized protein n=1 Tax=Primulina eburnea TaxID=1245227 RepID=UPI003C6C6C77